MLTLRFSRGLLVVVLMTVFLPSPSLAMHLVKDGKPQAMIVIPDKAYPVVEHAARELQYHVREATGAELAVVRESRKPDTSLGLIYLGDCNQTRRAGIDTQQLPPSAFVIRTVGKDLFLAGHDNDRSVGSHWVSTWHGTLWAVYEFLEKEMSVRWLWPGKLGEVIPKRADIEITALDQTQEPRFLETFLEYKSTRAKEYWSSAKNYEKYEKAQSTWFLRHRLNTNTLTLRYGHYFHNAKYWERFHKSHPEFFGRLPDGTRRRIPGPSLPPHAYTMCVAEPALHRQMIEDWKTSRERDPNVAPYKPFVNACDNDMVAYCTCPKCRAWDAPDPAFENHDYWSGNEVLYNVRYQAAQPDSKGRPPPRSLSDRYARFYLAVQKEAQKVDPNAVVAGFAYSNYSKPPVQTKLNKNILIIFVDWPMFPWTNERLEEMRRSWDGWVATGARMKLRPNTMLSGHNMPIYLARKLGNEISHCAESGMVGTNFDSLTGQWATQGPTLYVLGRVHVRPDWPVEKILDEYYSAFGPAEPAVRRYFGYWEQVSDAVTLEQWNRYQKEVGGASHNNWYKIAPCIFTPEVMAKGRSLLEKAAEAARGDVLAEKRVSFLEKGLRNAELTLAVGRAHRDHARKPNSPEEFTAYHKAIRELALYRQGVEADNICNMGWLAKREQTGGWDYSLAKKETDTATPAAMWKTYFLSRSYETADRDYSDFDKVARRLPAEWKFRWDPEKKGEREKWYSPKLDDSGWLDIGVDSHWKDQQAGKAWKETHGRDYQGIAWYRNRFAVRKQDPSKKIYLVFGAVDAAGKIWVNGKLVLERRFYSTSWEDPFDVNVTDVVRTDELNTLAVRVDNVAMAGGIWKPVWIIISP